MSRRPFVVRRPHRALVATLTALVLLTGLLVAPQGQAADPPLQPITPPPGSTVDNTFVLHSRVIGAPFQIDIGNQARTPDPFTFPEHCNSAVWVLVLARDSGTLKTVRNTNYPMCSRADAKKLDDDLTDLGKHEADKPLADSTPLVIVNSITKAPDSTAQVVAGLRAALGKIGADKPDFDAMNLSDTGFSVVGIPGLPAGGAYTSTDELAEEAHLKAGEVTPASIDGTLARDQNGNWAVTTPDYATYDIGAAGSVTLNDEVRPAPPKPDGFTGGFRLVVLDQRTLKPLSDRIYSTRNRPVGELELVDRLDELADENDQRPVLILLSTIGDPYGGRFLPHGPLTDLPPDCATSAAFTVTCTYKFIGEEAQTFTVPKDVDGYPVTSLHVNLQGGAAGRAGSDEFPSFGGSPDRVIGDLPIGTPSNGVTVEPGDRLTVRVGGPGRPAGGLDGGNGGWNGGGRGGDSGYHASWGWPGGGGGGGSDITLNGQAVAVAAGGGGAGGQSHDGGRGGDGGAANGRGQDGSHGDNKAGLVAQGGAPGAGPHGGSGSGTDRGFGASGGGGGGLLGGAGGGIPNNGHDPDANGGGAGGGGGTDLVPPHGSAEPVAHPAEFSTVQISYRVPFGTLAQTLRPWGATPGIINQLPTQPTYSLVGTLATEEQTKQGLQPDSPEASPLISADITSTAAATGELQGVLSRGTDMDYESLTSNAPMKEDGGQPTRTNYGLYDVISPRTTEAWPVPQAGTNHDAQQAALVYLSNKACGNSDGTGCDNIRDHYNAPGGTLDKWNTLVTSAPYVADHGFDQANFDKVQQQLSTELTDARQVADLEHDMRDVIGLKNGTTDQELQNAYDNVKKSLPELDDKTGMIVSIVAFILEVFAAGAELLHFDAIAVALGVIGAALGFSFEMAHEANGKDETDELQTTVGELRKETLEQFSAALENLGTTFGYILGNWGKLKTVAAGLTGPHSDAWSINDVGQAVQAESRAATLGYYRALVGATYQRYEAMGAPTGDMAKWSLDGKPAADYGFHVPTSAYTFATAAPGVSLAPAADNTIVTVKTSSPKSVSPVPESLMEDLRTAGLYPPYLFTRWSLEEGSVCPVNLRGSNGDVAFACQSQTALGGEPLTITTQQLPDAEIGRPYRATLSASGGDGGQHRWSLAAGSHLPAGIALNRDGTLSGTPTAAGRYRFTVSVDDPVTAPLVLTVRPRTLAATGVSQLSLLALGLALLVTGGAATAVGNRRRRRPLHRAG